MYTTYNICVTQLIMSVQHRKKLNLLQSITKMKLYEEITKKLR